jgi:eukaryotic-like serine/threonine-protein kinase
MAASSLARFFRFGAFQLDLRAGELRRNGVKVRVPDQSIQVLVMLLEHPGEVVTREELHQKLWPNGTIVEFDHSINAAMKRLRQALEDSAEEPRFIETLPRRGYRFILPVEQVESSETAAPSDPEPKTGKLAGRTISHYRILRKLGQGAMGVVYEAEDTSLGRSVAIKFLSEELSDDPLALGRFQREARAASALNHPNICTVHEVGEYEDVPFIVMEYVTGKSLDQLIGPDGLPVNKVLNYAVQITDALVRAHSAGIIHRDLKPANIMVNQDGLVKLLDFGLAKVRSAAPIAGLPTPARTPLLTGEGAILGTLQYMAPEQLEGREADARTDIFALGAVFYEMATGRKAFEGKSQANLIAAILEREPPLVSSACRLTAPTLDRVVATCLAKKPDDRWQTAEDLLRELKCVAEDRDQPLGAPAMRRNWLVLTWALVAGLWTRKRALAVVLTVTALAATGFGVYRWLVPPPKFSVETVHFTKLTDSGAAEVAAISPDGRYVTYTVRQGEKVGLWLRQITAQGAVESGVGILPPEALGIWGLTFSPDGDYIYFLREVRGNTFFKNLYMMPVLGGRVQLVITDAESPVSFSPDGRELVFERNLSQGGVELRIANVNGSGERLLTTFRDGDISVYHPGPSWSPDGRTIAVPVGLGLEVGWTLALVSVANGSVREIRSNPTMMGHPVWLPGGDTLLLPFGNKESSRIELWTISVSGGKGRRFTNDLTDYSPYLDITRDGRMAAATASTWVFNIWVFEAADLTNGRQITSGELPMLDVVEIPDGRLVSESQNGNVWIVNADGSERRLLTPIRGGVPFDSCGGFVIFRSSGDALTRVDADGASIPIRISGGLTIATCTPDGSSIYYVTEKRPRKIMRLPFQGGHPTEIARLRGDIASAFSGRLCLSPDGKFLAYVSVEGSPGSWIVNVIQIDGGSLIKTFKLPGSLRVRKLSWSPNGQGLQYLIARDGAWNILEQPLDGAEPRQVTNFNSGAIFSFFWSADHKRLVMTRGSISNNVVLVDFRPDEHK